MKDTAEFPTDELPEIMLRSLASVSWDRGRDRFDALLVICFFDLCLQRGFWPGHWALPKEFNPPYPTTAELVAEMQLYRAVWERAERVDYTTSEAELKQLCWQAPDEAFYTAGSLLEVCGDKEVDAVLWFMIRICYFSSWKMRVHLKNVMRFVKSEMERRF